jgi:predicted nuclease of predicted toxin-antitoxin system
MKLLLDANISHKIIDALKVHFEDCAHVNFIGLSNPAKDIEIWNFAFEKDYMIVTNDEDFLYFMMAKKFPPKLILLRTGNQSSSNLKNILINHKVAIKDLYHSSVYGLLEIY